MTNIWRTKGSTFSMGGQGRHIIGYIEAVVIARNERSTRSWQAEQLVARLQAAAGDKRITMVAVGDDDTAADRQRLLAELRKAPGGRSLLVVAGGDGTAHFVASTLLHPDTPAAYRITPVTAWPLGNGNDFFHSIHSAAVAHDPLQAICGAGLRSVQVYPLEWRIRLPDGGEQHEFSLCYGTVGATANTAVMLSEPARRERRKNLDATRSLLLDIRDSGRTLWFPQQFEVAQDGKAYTAIELQFSNGPLMGMHARYPVLLSDRTMFFSKASKGDPLTVGATALRMGLGNMPGTRCHEPLHFHLAGNRPIHAQTDGEAFMLPKNVRFTVGPCAQPLVVWASKTA